MVFDYTTLIGAVLSIVIPTAIQFTKAFVPNIPSVFLPWISVGLGAGLGFLGNYLGMAGINPLVGMIGGAVGSWGYDVLKTINERINPPALPVPARTVIPAKQ